MYHNILNKTLLLNVLSLATKKLVIRYPSPQNIGYFWNFGSLSGLFLVIQIVTGLFLTMFYVPNIDYAFISVDNIMRNISYGWLIRYLHANGASFFFFFVYIHMFRGIYYNSYQYPRTHIWMTGVIIYFLLMAAAFLGYVLPWGQMSFWAATVITNVITVVPYIGEDLIHLVWGGYSVNNATLNRFFCLHYLIPFIIVVFMLLHLILLHQTSSSNELSINPGIESRILFYPYFIIKDIFGVIIALVSYSYIVFFMPEIFNDSVNYIPANPLVTPPHIVPEWYFLPYYAILRSVLNKTDGILVLILSISVFILLPLLNPGIGKSYHYNYYYRVLYWVFFFNFVFLGFLGSQTAEVPCIDLGLFCTLVHLSFPFILLPLFSMFLDNKHNAY